MKIMRDEFHDAEDSPDRVMPDRRLNPERFDAAARKVARNMTPFNLMLVAMLLGFPAIALICAYYLDGWIAFGVATGMCWIWAAVCLGALILYDSIELKRAYRALGETDD